MNEFSSSHQSIFAVEKKLMQLIIRATEAQKMAVLKKGLSNNISIVWVEEIDPVNIFSANAIFDFITDSSSTCTLQTAAPFFVNEAAITCRQLPENYIRINAWPGFFERDIVEISAGPFIKEKAAQVLQQMGWKFITAPDEPGMIGAGIICMIINEAYFALEEGVSSMDEIDTAMKLGTNYPYGPFEWSKKIGLQQVYNVLYEMEKKDEHFTINSLLKIKAGEMNIEQEQGKGNQLSVFINQKTDSI